MLGHALLKTASIDQPLFIILVVFEILFLISFGAFFILFYIRNKLTRQEYDIKTSFNDINRLSGSDQFKYLTILSKNNEKLNDLMNDINNSRDYLENQLKIVKDKIMALTELNENFNFKSANEVQAELYQDISSCSFMVDKINKTIQITSDYSKNVCEILVNYRQIANDIDDFFHNNLAIKYNNKIFAQLVNKINIQLSEVSEYAIKINNEKLIQLLNELNLSIETFNSLVRNVYILNRVNLFLVTAAADIKKQIKAKAGTLSSADELDVSRKMAIANTSTTDLQTCLNNVDIKTAYNHAIFAIKNIEAVTRIMLQTEKSSILIQKHIRFLGEQLEIIKDNTKIISSAFQSISERFKTTDNAIVDKIDLYSNDLISIALSYNGIIKEYKRYDSIERNQLILRIKELFELIKKYKINLDTIANDIYSKYHDSIAVIDEIADIKLILIQLLASKISTNSEDNGSTNSIKNMITRIDKLEEKLNENYFANYPIVHQEIQEIKNQILDIIKSCAFDSTLKAYAQRLFIFLNKYRNEAPEIDAKLNDAEDYYKKAKFHEAIDLLIKILNVIKYSSKVNNIAFS